MESMPKSLALRAVLTTRPLLLSLQAKETAILVVEPITLVFTLILQSFAFRALTRSLMAKAASATT
eukprot:15282800-Heterocapsa_arctica.AAC.1